MDAGSGWGRVLFLLVHDVLKSQVLRLSRLEEMARAEPGCPVADSSDITIITAIFKL